MIDEVSTIAQLLLPRETARLDKPLSFIFLYGPSGAGKSAIAPRLAKALCMPWLDLDDEIEHSSGRGIPEIFTHSGEAAFRLLETKTLQQAVSGLPSVIALGGGALLDPHNRRVAEASGTVVCLSAPLDVLTNRIQKEPKARPMLNLTAADQVELHLQLAQLLESRGDHYSSFPVQINTARASPVEVSRQIQVRLGRFYLQGIDRLNPHGCPVFVQPGGLAVLGSCLQQLSLRGPVAVVADSNVSALYGDSVLDTLHHSGFDASIITFPAGETHKSLDTVASLYQAFSALKLDRKSTVIALGGGITSDLAGFAASTYLRGVNWVVVPTTLLAMADASIGGKTGFDLPQGKNLVGSFYPPRLVLADPVTLQTLPQRELIAGLAEVVKAGLIADPGLLDLCAKGWTAVSDHMEELLRLSIAVKVTLVRADPFEHDRRAALNLGHTIGHAVEIASDYRLLHGEAVAIGMVIEARLSEQIGLAHVGLADNIEACLSGLGLPIKIPAGLSQEAIVRAMSFDKKRLDGTVRFSLPIRPGRVKVSVQVENWANIILKGRKR